MFALRTGHKSLTKWVKCKEEREEAEHGTKWPRAKQIRGIPERI
jgi:hypothetical protein